MDIEYRLDKKENENFVKIVFDIAFQDNGSVA